MLKLFRNLIVLAASKVIRRQWMGDSHERIWGENQAGNLVVSEHESGMEVYMSKDDLSGRGQIPVWNLATHISDMFNIEDDSKRQRVVAIISCDDPRKNEEIVEECEAQDIQDKVMGSDDENDGDYHSDEEDDGDESEGDSEEGSGGADNKNRSEAGSDSTDDNDKEETYNVSSTPFGGESLFGQSSVGRSISPSPMITTTEVASDDRQAVTQSYRGNLAESSDDDEPISSPRSRLKVSRSAWRPRASPSSFLHTPRASPAADRSPRSPSPTLNLSHGTSEGAVLSMTLEERSTIRDRIVRAALSYDFNSVQVDGQRESSGTLTTARRPSSDASALRQSVGSRYGGSPPAFGGTSSSSLFGGGALAPESSAAIFGTNTTVFGSNTTLFGSNTTSSGSNTAATGLSTSGSGSNAPIFSGSISELGSITTSDTFSTETLRNALDTVSTPPTQRRTSSNSYGSPSNFTFGSSENAGPVPFNFNPPAFSPRLQTPSRPTTPNSASPYSHQADAEVGLEGELFVSDLCFIIDTIIFHHRFFHVLITFLRRRFSTSSPPPLVCRSPHTVGPA